ncbi:hypothetical protein [Geobacter sp.]|uniref:hypothetical protein n=1 Tax=Geobacter sp. TaxID=46610 RepID=UPI002609DFF3|nr:hypothetical protein [Geobacter sp.]
MRKRTIRVGIYCIIMAVIVVTASTFFHSVFAAWLGLSSYTEVQLVYDGLFWGGLFGGVGVVMAVAGLLAGAPRDSGHSVRLTPHLIVLAAVIFIFALLFFSSFHNPDTPSLRPGETITI